MPAHNDATASYLGYLFQGQYALLALWDATDDDAAVSVETEDDVVLDGREPRLAQLKHSTGTRAPLTITDAGFWKTIRIWADHIASDPTVRTTTVESDPTKYLFVTVGHVADGDALQALVRRDDSVEHGPEAEHATDAALTALTALTAEATRVHDDRLAASAAGIRLPHTERGPGCEAFLALSGALRRRLVARIQILPGSFRLSDISGEVERRLQRAGTVRAALRPRLAERLIERWDRQVTLALLKQRNREIQRAELQGIIEDLIQELGPESLTNDYGALSPDDQEYEAAHGTMLERQVQLVSGGQSRVTRAVRDRWRARNQRRRWTDDDASLVPLLKAFDDTLVEAWADRHGPMRDDCSDREEAERRERGLNLLDWAHDNAPSSVPPPRPNWNHAFYAHGMLHQFADDLQVGWHPDFRERLDLNQSGPTDGTGLPGPTVVAEGAPEAYAPAATSVTPASDLEDQLPPELPVGPTHEARHTASTRPPTRSRRTRRASTD